VDTSSTCHYCGSPWPSWAVGEILRSCKQHRYDFLADLLAEASQAAAIQICITPSPETFALYDGLYLYIKGGSLYVCPVYSHIIVNLPRRICGTRWSCSKVLVPHRHLHTPGGFNSPCARIQETCWCHWILVQLRQGLLQILANHPSPSVHLTSCASMM
jgi:hypothetical protein